MDKLQACAVVLEAHKARVAAAILYSRLTTAETFDAALRAQAALDAAIEAEARL